MWHSSVERMCCVFSKDAAKPAEISLTCHRVTDSIYPAAMATALISVYLWLFSTQIMASPIKTVLFCDTEYLMHAPLLFQAKMSWRLIFRTICEFWVRGVEDVYYVMFRSNVHGFLYFWCLGQVSRVSMWSQWDSKEKEMKWDEKRQHTKLYWVQNSRRGRWHLASEPCLHVDTNPKKSGL